MISKPDAVTDVILTALKSVTSGPTFFAARAAPMSSTRRPRWITSWFPVLRPRNLSPGVLMLATVGR
jgi:hypothetical protein